MLTNILAEHIQVCCTLSVVSQCVLIKCKDVDSYTYLIQQRNNIADALRFIIKTHTKPIYMATIAVEGTHLRTSFPISSQRPPMIITIPTNPTDPIITECLSYDGACGIVRMSDHKGLFSNSQITMSSNASPNDWLGKTMSDFWIKEELDAYLQRLQKEKELRNYSYVAKMMDGQNARLTVNARMIEWHGEPARIVQTIKREFLA